MKNLLTSVKKNMVAKYFYEETVYDEKKSTDINILLNRVKLNKKRESRNKIIFSAATTVGIVIFGVLVF
tara:strand:- start:161 stop:367 length:207 start_codon:yes stop_codon:yes gene_type:complete